eukprot:CAMPEP_0194257388 /NCGR_PEP_ID=MMETSP0158-20130606/38929_1 /TAXON_ID=33649 /ORGANISM="Thalassionema nitzschioides, Strain L26-B" /LENGTH=159 /DNA_ID=CAMNT_0038996413 /DNA_START=1 /DNA_END=477 /DNA_ORIENTATION=+
MDASSSGSSSSRLAAAAEELLKAAGAESATENQKKMVTGIKSLKASMDAKLNTIEQNLSTLKDHMGNKVSEIDKRLETMSEAITSIKAEGKMQRLAFAISNADLNSFICYYEENGEYYKESKSNDLVRRILFSFRINFGHYLPKGSMKRLDAYAVRNNE